MIEIVRLDEQRRLQLGNPILQSIGVDVAPGVTSRVWALTAASGQIQILPPASELAKLRDERNSGGTAGATWDSSGDTATALRRRLDGFFLVTCRRRTRGDKVRLTLPADIVSLGLLNVDDAVVIYSSGEILELWSRDRWEQASRVQHVRDFTKKLQELDD